MMLAMLNSKAGRCACRPLETEANAVSAMAQRERRLCLVMWKSHHLAEYGASGML